MRGVVSEYLSPNGLSLASNSSFNGESLPCAMGSGPLSRQGVCRPTAMLCIALSLSSYFVGLFVAQQLFCALARPGRTSEGAPAFSLLPSEMPPPALKNSPQPS